MNDFTKEELEIIRRWAVAEISQSGLVNFSGTPQRELQRKIISMIDGYCEHEEHVSTTDENGHMLVMCGRFDLVLWHEKE